MSYTLILLLRKSITLLSCSLLKVICHNNHCITFALVYNTACTEMYNYLLTIYWIPQATIPHTKKDAQKIFVLVCGHRASSEFEN